MDALHTIVKPDKQVLKVTLARQSRQQYKCAKFKKPHVYVRNGEECQISEIKTSF